MVTALSLLHFVDPSLSVSISRVGLQIRFILLQNRQGKTRLAKYYVPLEESEKHKVEYEVTLSLSLSLFIIDPPLSILWLPLPDS